MEYENNVEKKNSNKLLTVLIILTSVNLLVGVFNTGLALNRNFGRNNMDKMQKQEAMFKGFNSDSQRNQGDANKSRSNMPNWSNDNNDRPNMQNWSKDNNDRQERFGNFKNNNKVDEPQKSNSERFNDKLNDFINQSQQ